MYPVIRVIEYDHGGTQDLENWLNERRRAGFELVAVTGNMYIFSYFPHSFNPMVNIDISKSFVVDSSIKEFPNG